MNIQKQRGFTLVEIAIVLIIIGLLLGGILKGQELINSARVRNLADQNTSIQAAYYGFIDRYRRVPGDWSGDDAIAALGVEGYTALFGGVAGVVGGNNDHIIDHNLTEASIVWAQLVLAKFLGGGIVPVTDIPGGVAAYANGAPRNSFGGALILSRNDGYTNAPAATPAPERLNLQLGENVPVAIARELDVKLDDGLPNTGVLRLTNVATEIDFNTELIKESHVTCSAPTGAVTAGTEAATDLYDIADDIQDCGQVFLY